MELYSKYLKEKFDVNITETDGEGKKISVISHDSLRNILVDLSARKGVMYSYTPLQVSQVHSVFLCTVEDQSGRKITEIGESTKYTLVGNIGKGYPSLVAAQRAFDRAVIAYLGFDGKFLSSTELSINIPTLLDEVGPSEISEIANDIYDDQISENEEIQLDPTECYDDIPEEAYIDYSSIENAEEVEDQIQEAVINNDNSKIEELENIVISFGKFKGKTVSEVATEKNVGWIKYALGFKQTTRETRTQIDALREVCLNRNINLE